MDAGARRRLWFAALLLLPFAFRDDLSRFALARVGAFAVAATGVAIVSGLAGQISLGHAGLMAAGAYTSAGLAVHAGWPFAAAAVAGVLLSAAVGVVFGVPSLRVRGQHLALATLGGGFIIWQLVRQLSSVTGSDFGLAGIPEPSVGGALGPLGSAVLAMALAAVALFIAGNLEGSRPGRALRAVRDSETGASASGISVYRAKLGAFVLSAVLAGAGGALFAHTEGFIAPGQFDPGRSFLLVLTAVLGGLASPYGAALGVLLVLGPSDLFPGAFSWLERYQLVAWGPVALLVVFRWPDGVAGGIARLVRRLRREPPSLTSGDGEHAAPSLPAITPAPPDAPLLVARGVTKSFGGLRALHEVSLEVRAGTIHALIGPNGSGKTTLLDCVTGIIRGDAGEIAFAGRRIDGLAPHRVAALGVGRTFQQVALFGSMTAEENVLTGAHLLGRGGFGAGSIGLDPSGEMLRDEARAVLAMVGLAGSEGEPAKGLSFGQRKRLELARALACRPSLLLLDEPAAGRNEPEILELGRFLKRLRAAGLTILLVEHHMNFVLSLADVVTVLDEGRVVAHGDPSAVRADPAVVEAYLGATVA